MSIIVSAIPLSCAFLHPIFVALRGNSLLHQSTLEILESYITDFPSWRTSPRLSQRRPLHRASPYRPLQTRKPNYDSALASDNVHSNV